MLNRLLIIKYIEKIFDNLNELDYLKIYNYINKKNTEPLPDDMNKAVKEVYYKILLNEKNKKIDIETQIQIVQDFYNKFKEYLIEANKVDRVLNSKLSLIELELPILFNFLKNRNTVRTMRRGYK